MFAFALVAQVIAAAPSPGVTLADAPMTIVAMSHAQCLIRNAAPLANTAEEQDRLLATTVAQCRAQSAQLAQLAKMNGKSFSSDWQADAAAMSGQVEAAFIPEFKRLEPGAIPRDRYKLMMQADDGKPFDPFKRRNIKFDGHARLFLAPKQ